MIEVLITLQLNEEQVTSIRDAIKKQIRITHLPVKDSSEISAEQWKKTEVLFTSSRVLPEQEQVPNLKWIQFNFAGIDAAIAKPIIQSKDVIATSASGVIVTQIGEYVLMALLALGHRMPEMHALQHEKKWPGNVYKTLMPKELRGSTVGIVGYGSIGREVARLLKPFGATILAAKKDAMHPEDAGYVPEGVGDPGGDYFNRLYPIEALYAMLGECDFVVLALPLTDDTYHMFNAQAFGAMRTDAYLVNVGRGDVIDEKDMVGVLKEGKIAGAMLDVFSHEPLSEDSPLWSLPNVIVTPHVSGISPHLIEDIVGLFIENMKRYVEGQPLWNRIDLEKGY